MPIGAGLFALWLALFSNLPTLRKRLLLMGLFLLSFVPMYYALSISLYFFFVGGPSAFISVGILAIRLGPLSFLTFPIILAVTYLAYPGILALFWGGAWLQGLRLSWRLYLQSAIVYLPAWKWAVMVAPLTQTIPDSLHTLKSGNLFFFMVIGLGLPFLAPYRETESGLIKIWRFMRKKRLRITKTQSHDLH
ncbi:MAG: hypothetical protein AAGG51_27520 [Cyanobacteria bacterium P01_G01_bin.54]